MGLPFLPGIKLWTQEVHKTASYALLATDSGSLFIVDSGAVTFTLPTLLAVPDFIAYFLNVSASAMAITAPANKLIADGNATGTTGTFSTATHIIGSACMVFLNTAQTFFHLVPFGGTVCTVT